MSLANSRPPTQNHPRRLLLGLCLLLMVRCPALAGDANRFTNLDAPSDPYHPSATFPRLTTPQWVGEPGVDVVVTYGIDDMSRHAPYEQFLRPILDRLKQIDGRASLSIFCNSPNPSEPHLQEWLKEGVTLEVHTLNHPCPILGTGGFASAQNTFHGCVDLLNHVPNNQPVAFRTPCCDSINSASPRLFAELFARTNAAGQFLRMDSSITLLLTPNDPSLPAERLIDAQGRPRFLKYVPFEAFSTTIENYPYPYIHTRVCWEMPFVAPSDWQSFNLQGSGHPQMLEDWKTALDLIALKQGVFNYVFHPAGWSTPTQHVAFIDHAVAQYGSRLRFLNYREVHDRLTKNVLSSQPLRAADGRDNGIRLLDLNGDGWMDVVIGNDRLRRTRIWDPAKVQWIESSFPTRIVADDLPTETADTGARFGVVGPHDEPILIVANERESGAWKFSNGVWAQDDALLRGLELDGKPILTAMRGRDLGARLRDLDHDGSCEFLIANETQNAVFHWIASERTWRRAPWGFPNGATLVNGLGQDNGLRFVDLNADGREDVVFSNEDHYSIHLMVPTPILGFTAGWSREVLRGKRGQVPEVPPFVRTGSARNNGAWFTHDSLYVQNEETSRLPHIVERHSISELLSGLMPAALSPTQSLAAVQVPPGFQVELVAHEPQVQDPVYMEFGEDGRLWVVEMHDYPLGTDGQGKPGGDIRVLEDRDGDGFYEHSTVFAAGLRFPNGLLPWGKGVLISSAPEIIYAEDTDGDGKADKFETLFTGFGQGNQQHRFNGFELGLDNWIYGANGDSGGNVHAPDSGQAVGLGGHDFRFRPFTKNFESIEGQTQFGRHRDDWGNWFGNANPVWLWHYWIPEHYLRRNRTLAVDSIRRETATYPNAGRVHAIGRKPQRLNDVGAAGSVTSANSPTPYRDDLFGAEFEHAVFISEPVFNVIRCEILSPEGISFTSHRWNAESDREFLASSDPWFRPTGLRVGPDGALYVADMYRQFIEHPEWIPDDIKTRYNMRAGDDKGRIYRIRPTNVTPRKFQRLDGLSTDALAQRMDSASGWQRDTAQRLLFLRRDKKAASVLATLLASSKSPKVRLSALCTLDGLGSLTALHLEQALHDEHGSVREHAVRLTETDPTRQPISGAAEVLFRSLPRLEADLEPKVRYQLALSLGEYSDPRVASSLARLATGTNASTDLMTAIASSATKDPMGLLASLASHRGDLERCEPLLRNLVTLLMDQASSASMDAVFAKLLEPRRTEGLAESWQVGVLAQLLGEFEKRSRSLDVGSPLSKALPPLLASARQLAKDESAGVQRRVAGVGLLGRDPMHLGDDAASLVACLTPRSPVPLQRAALKRLAQLPQASVLVSNVVSSLESYSPATRAEIMDVILRREEGARALLAEVGAGRLRRDSLGAGAVQRLLSHPQSEVQKRAKEIFSSSVSSERQSLINAYLPAVKTARGDTDRGAAQFRKHCSVCHPLNQQGTGAAPDLASVVDRSPERMLVAILDPSRAVEDRYRAYTVRMKSGDELTGMMASESVNSVTLMSVSGGRETVLRRDIAAVQATGLSIMPEGFEQFLKAPDIADILVFLDSATSPPRSFPGNRPEIVGVDPLGAIRLRAVNAEIHGEGIAFESQYKNLGSWNGPEAKAVWTLDIPTGGSYDVWLHWACHENEAGDPFVFETGDTSVTGTVASTGTWDLYRAAKVGKVNLAAGRQRASFHATTHLKGYLIDLLEVRLVPSNTPKSPAFMMP